MQQLSLSLSLFRSAIRKSESLGSRDAQTLQSSAAYYRARQRINAKPMSLQARKYEISSRAKC